MSNAKDHLVVSAVPRTLARTLNGHDRSARPIDPPDKVGNTVTSELDRARCLAKRGGIKSRHQQIAETFLFFLPFPCSKFFRASVTEPWRYT